VTPINAGTGQAFAADAASVRFRRDDAGFGGFDAISTTRGRRAAIERAGEGQLPIAISLRGRASSRRPRPASGLPPARRNPHRAFRHRAGGACVRAQRDLLRATLEGGAVVWSSPIYLIRQA